jgi:uncharacterized protein YjeT (DUF2065 family)
MSVNDIWLALALVLIVEGLMPFISPKTWRRLFEQMLTLQDGQIRFFGLVVIALGLGLLWLITL